MTDFDKMEGGALNRRIAELRGWENIHLSYGVLFGVPPKSAATEVLPDIEGDNHAALDAAEWMVSQGWEYFLDCWGQEDYTARFHKGDVLSRSEQQPKLSEAIARAMGRALEAK